jgi:PAS domain S-box-containing protein
MKHQITPTRVERFFNASDIIVSKTDRKGRITYANRTFCTIAGYTEDELLGQPHSIVRHPDMPRAVFKLLWDTLGEKREIFAYVKNIAKNGDYYWVLAHATPSWDEAGNVIAYHSNRRVPKRDVVLNVISPLYAAVLEEERGHANGQQALAAGFDFLVNFLKSKNTTYDALVHSL